jgi:thiol-disulfide isomerase/thioredoxin
MKKLFYLLVFTFLLFPFIVNAKEYEDKIYDIVEMEKSEVVTIYFFHSEVCIHCKHETEFLDKMKKKYKDKIEIVKFQVYKNDDNLALLKEVKKRMECEENGVPFTVIGEDYFHGYSDAIGDQIMQTIEEYVNGKNKVGTRINVPLFGKVNLEKISIPVVALILGILDGFNPCAMWILLFLINMLFNMKDRKRMWLLGFTFLFTSAFVYFLAMLGLSVVLGLTATTWIQRIIAVVAIIGGLINLRSFQKTKDGGCHVVDEKKRKKYFAKMKKFTTEQNLILSLIGVITLAASVNLVELACSAGFPTIFITILVLNNVGMFAKVLYILIYILFFLVDDIVVFVVAMKTLEISGVTTKYNKYSHLVGGILMILIGLLLIFKPEWIMLNF